MLSQYFLALSIGKSLSSLATSDILLFVSEKTDSKNSFSSKSKKSNSNSTPNILNFV